MSPQQSLLKTLFAELFQTERSAAVHPRREARRLGNCPPSETLVRVAEHADRVMPRIESLARARQAGEKQWGKIAGEALSFTRMLTVDRLVEVERSYRGTLAGMRHGCDVVALLAGVAEAAGDHELQAFCAAWTKEREPLVNDVASALGWFARHPDVAVERPWHPVRARTEHRAARASRTDGGGLHRANE